MNKLPKF